MDDGHVSDGKENNARRRDCFKSDSLGLDKCNNISCMLKDQCPRYDKDSKHGLNVLPEGFDCRKDGPFVKHLENGKYGDYIMATSAYNVLELQPFMHIHSESFCGLDRIRHLILPEIFDCRFLSFIRIHSESVMVTIKDDNLNDDGYYSSFYMPHSSLRRYLFDEEDRDIIRDKILRLEGRDTSGTVNGYKFFGFTKNRDGSERIVPGTYIVTKNRVLKASRDSLVYGGVDYDD